MQEGENKPRSEATRFEIEHERDSGTHREYKVPGSGQDELEGKGSSSRYEVPGDEIKPPEKRPLIR